MSTCFESDLDHQTIVIMANNWKETRELWGLIREEEPGIPLDKIMLNLKILDQLINGEEISNPDDRFQRYFYEPQIKRGDLAKESSNDSLLIGVHLELWGVEKIAISLNKDIAEPPLKNSAILRLNAICSDKKAIDHGFIIFHDRDENGGKLLYALDYAYDSKNKCYKLSKENYPSYPHGH